MLSDAPSGSLKEFLIELFWSCLLFAVSVFEGYSFWEGGVYAAFLVPLASLSIRLVFGFWFKNPLVRWQWTWPLGLLVFLVLCVALSRFGAFLSVLFEFALMLLFAAVFLAFSLVRR